MEDVTKKIFIGKREKGRLRLANIMRLAEMYYPRYMNGKLTGNFSRLYNEAVDEKYNLDPETGQPLGGLPPVPKKAADAHGDLTGKDAASLAADSLRKKRGRPQR